jgi:hypothetical protein
MWTAGGGAERMVKVEGKAGTPVHWEDARVVILTNIFAMRSLSRSLLR